jgi:diketogulonate reductase-like aldo/keto reductase
VSTPPALAAGAAAAPGSLPQRVIPSSGECLPVLGLGTFRAFDVPAQSDANDELAAVTDRFLAAGARLIDSSPMYGEAEAAVGRALNTRPAFLATKVWTQGRREGIAQMQRSFARLKVDTLDLMQVHNLVDTQTHLDTLRAWKAEGRIRYLGITHYHGSAHAALEHLVRTEQPDFVQLNYHALDRDAEARLLPAAADCGTAVLVNRPLGQGELLRRLRGRALPAWARAEGWGSWAQLLLAWVVAHPAVTCVIPATANPSHMAENIAALATDPRRPALDAAFSARVLSALRAA